MRYLPLLVLHAACQAASPTIDAGIVDAPEPIDAMTVDADIGDAGVADAKWRPPRYGDFCEPILEPCRDPRLSCYTAVNHRTFLCSAECSPTALCDPPETTICYDDSWVYGPALCYQFCDGRTNTCPEGMVCRAITDGTGFCTPWVSLSLALPQGESCILGPQGDLTCP